MPRKNRKPYAELTPEEKAAQKAAQKAAKEKCLAKRTPEKVAEQKKKHAENERIRYYKKKAEIELDMAAEALVKMKYSHTLFPSQPTMQETNPNSSVKETFGNN